MSFPRTRMRRLRRTEALRALVTQTRLHVEDLVQPLFVRSGSGIREEIASMPGCFRLSVDEAVRECRNISEVGIPAVLLFGIPEYKDEEGSAGWDDNGVVQQAVRSIKEQIPSLLVITDVCNCEYTSHGHCGPLTGGEVDNDRTLEILSRQALSHARAGTDILAPSDMMDGRVGRIRTVLDGNGFEHLPIMSYAVKYASAFYGPFRDAAGSTPVSGDRRGYQMDPANGDEALREVALDLEEGADIVMIKPALAYLDVIWRVKQQFGVPVAAYNVSGEFSMVAAASDRGWLDRQRTMMEILTSIKRAGADVIITYHALEAARMLRQG